MRALRSSLTLLLLTVTTSIYAQIPLVSARIDAVSRYHWRGMELADRPAIQPGVDVNMGTLTLSAWGSWVLEDRTVRDDDGTSNAQKDEVDLTIDYTVGLPSLIDVSAGGTLYTYPNTGSDRALDWFSPEVYVGAKSQIFLRPQLKAFYDFNMGAGLYVEGAIGHDFPTPGPDLTTTFALGYNQSQFGYRNQVSHFALGVSTEVGAGPFYLSPMATFVHSYLQDENRLLFGIAVGFN